MCPKPSENRISTRNPPPEKKQHTHKTLMFARVQGLRWEAATGHRHLPPLRLHPEPDSGPSGARWTQGVGRTPGTSVGPADQPLPAASVGSKAAPVRWLFSPDNVSIFKNLVFLNGHVVWQPCSARSSETEGPRGPLLAKGAAQPSAGSHPAGQLPQRPDCTVPSPAAAPRRTPNQTRCWLCCRPTARTSGMSW